MNAEQMKVYADSPHRYAHIQRQVDLAMRHSDKPCIGEPCDDINTCPRHARTTALVLRVTRR